MAFFLCDSLLAEDLAVFIVLPFFFIKLSMQLLKFISMFCLNNINIRSMFYLESFQVRTILYLESFQVRTILYIIVVQLNSLCIEFLQVRLLRSLSFTCKLINSILIVLSHLIGVTSVFFLFIRKLLVQVIYKSKVLLLGRCSSFFQ
jgi:hypothetical protein